MKVLFEDNHIIVVVKEPGVLTQSDYSSDTDLLTQLKEYLKEKYKKPGNVYVGLVHRLDRNVGGVMVFAKTSKASNRLSEQIRNNTLQKRYLAIVDRKIEQKNWQTLTDYLIKDEANKKSQIVSESDGGKRAELDYRVISNKAGLSLLEIKLKTGRFHQIRVQLSNAGLPILGDKKYGYTGSESNLYLWAYSISFLHPVSKEILKFEFKPKWTLFKDFLSEYNQKD